MSFIQELSTLADSFPTIEVEYEDLIGMPFQSGGRVAAGDAGTDCAGVVLEIYRRAGLGLPDPGNDGAAIFTFASLLESVADATALFDIVNIRRESNHLAVLVQYGTILSATRSQGVYAAQLKNYRRLAGIEFWRVKDACLP